MTISGWCESKGKVWGLFISSGCMFGVVGFSAPSSAAPSTSADEALQKIWVEGTAPDVLTEDPVVPAYRGSVKSRSGSGQLERSLSQGLPLAVTDVGVPGVKSTFWGVGKSAGETDINTLGIPLNSPQGGGFDFSTFPAFLWTDYRFQLGPGLGVFDPSSSAGSLTLYPWTAQAVSGGAPRRGASANASFSQSSMDLNQVAAGVHVGPEKTGFSSALLLGQSSGRVKGTSGSASFRKDFGMHRAQFHFLGTNLDAESRTSIKSPLSHKFSTRLIPVLQTDFNLGGSDTDGAKLKNSFFYDRSITRSMGGARSNTRAEVVQYGTENVLLLGEGQKTRVALTGRSADYHTITQVPIKQNLLTAQVSHLIAFDVGAGAWLVDPLVRATKMVGFDWGPEGSLGARFEPRGFAGGFFTRASFTRKYASLADRFYVQAPAGPGSTGFRGNPDLKPEKNLTYVLGADGQFFADLYASTIQLMDQQRLDGHGLVNSTGNYQTYDNVDRARVMAVMWTNRLRLTSSLDFEQDYTWTHTQIKSSGAAFPNVPKHLSLTSLVLHGDEQEKLPSGEVLRNSKWQAKATLRASSSRVAQFESDPIPGYGLVDATLATSVYREEDRFIRVGLSVDNVMDREIFISEGYPLTERVFTLFLSGTI